MVVEAAIGVTGRKVYFCPISIGYERFVEEQSFVAEMSGGEKKSEDALALLKTMNLIVGRHGQLNVQFGELLTLDSVLAEIDPTAKAADLASMTPARRRAVVTRLAYRVMNEINRVTSVTAGALVATSLLTHDKRGLPHEDLVASCQRIARTLQRFGARFAPTLVSTAGDGTIRESALREALELFILAGHVEVHLPGAAAPRGRAKAVPADDAIYVVPPQARLSLDLAKNLIVHFFVSRGVVATALLAQTHEAGSVAVASLKERAQALSRLFKYEFQFRADATFDQIFDDVVAEMVADGELVRVGATLAPASADGREQIALYASMLRSFVEGYRVAARGLGALVRGALPTKELAKRTLAVGQRMFLAGEIERRESISRPVVENAFLAFADQGYVSRVEGKLSLAESFATATTVKAIEGRIAGFLPKR
jgi:glycerol-3-phosphate O-acyltransferase